MSGIFVVREQLNMMFRFCTVLYGGLLGYETVSTCSFDACAVIYSGVLIHSVFYSTRTSTQR